MSEKIILGIDPGTTIMGFGIIRVSDKKMSLIEMNELNLKKHKDHYLKLKLVFERTVSSLPKLYPAIKRGQEVDVIFNMPIIISTEN